ncbi:hypothetical protein CLSA_c37600 [Clostridium saccharobutylicum DSM 13864]|uniref:Uncharacterized protein n=1 Tax=Clostridium saccharobutylicum DSM 13864 TaxID=1345695 RepID=U5MYJ6_CLOSA|nr:hypothetical protein CLSA_c37600 [Clostridium saccharobutylicum DSM 13864]
MFLTVSNGKSVTHSYNILFVDSDSLFYCIDYLNIKERVNAI